MDFLRKNKIWIIFGLILALGIFFRSYHFSDWLRFELDQARDANVIDKAVSGGLAELPLLGPRAQSTYLRLGPAFYYISYVSAKIFGSTPPGVARGGMLISILALPVLYFYFRRYFKKYIAFILLTLASFSVFLIMYSRFAWNPNMLVFFVPFSFYALLRAVDSLEKRRGAWFVSSLAALSVSTQLHFLAFIILPIVFLIFLLIKRPKFNLAAWALGIFSVLLFYAPVFINEAMTGGDNTEEFFDAVSEKSDEYPASLAKKIFFNLKEHSAAYFVVLSGQDGNSLLALNLNGIASKFSECRENCPRDFYLGFLGVIFLVFGFGALIYRFIKEKDILKKDFLTLNGILFLACFIVFTPLALDISPRFFLLGAFMPFIFLGLIFELISKKYHLNVIVPAAVVMLLLFSNGKDIVKRFGELAAASQKNIDIGADLILKEKARVTHAQEISIVEYLVEKQKENGYPILFGGEARYVPALAYLLEKKGILNFNDKVGYKEVYRYVNYFWVDYANSGGRYQLGKKEQSVYDIVEAKNFGTLSVLSLTPKEELITGDYKIFKESENESNKPKRYTWRELSEQK